MVKKSFFARLFGRNEAPKFDEPEEIVPRRVAEKRAATGGKSRIPDIDFDDPAPAPVKKQNGASAASKPNGASAPRPVAKPEPPRAESAPAPPPSPERRADPVVAAPLVESVPLDAPPSGSSPAVKATEMSRDEEIALKLQEGFTGLSTVLRGIDTKIDQQQKTSEELIVSVKKIPEMMKDMPDASRAGLELLNTISSILEYQGRTTGELLSKMRELPGSLESMEQRFQEQVNKIARTSQDSDRVAKETQQRLTSAFDGVKRAVEEVQIQSSRRQDHLVEEMKRTQAASDARVEELLKRMGSANRVVVFLMIAVVAALLVAVWGMQR